MPSCLLSPFLIGKTNPRIRVLNHCHAWHRTKGWADQLPAKALTCAQKKLLGNTRVSTQDSLEQGTLQENLLQQDRRYRARSDHLLRNKGIEEPPHWHFSQENERPRWPYKGKSRERVGIASSLALWKWWGIRWASREQLPFGTTHANS